MKKTIPALLCLLCALAAGTAAFFGCTGGGDNPGGDSGDNTGGGTENSYSITATDGEGYNVEVDKTSAEFGETVTVTVEVTDHDKYVDSVRANSDTLGQNSDGTYTAIITADTTITVELADYEEVTSDGGVIWNSNNPETIIAGSNNGWYWDEDSNMVYAWTFDVIVNWNLVSMMNDRETWLTSSDQSVIPDDAISYEINKVSDGNSIAGFDVHIDPEKISEGHTWLTMSFHGGNGTSPDGTICIKITVADRIELETMKETVIIDYNGFAEEGDDVIVRFFDEDYAEGSYIDGEPAESYTEFKVKVDGDGKNTFELDYVKGHSYSISIYKSTEWYDGYLDTQEKQENVLMIDDSEEIFGGGSLDTGFNQYVDGKLSLVTEGLTVELVVEETFYDRNN